MNIDPDEVIRNYLKTEIRPIAAEIAKEHKDSTDKATASLRTQFEEAKDDINGRVTEHAKRIRPLFDLKDELEELQVRFDEQEKCLEQMPSNILAEILAAFRTTTW